MASVPVPVPGTSTGTSIGYISLTAGKKIKVRVSQ